ncbi:hypothetical protein VCHC55B2_2777A, partial [Vibrio cholerae HC-55B2]
MTLFAPPPFRGRLGGGINTKL